MVGHFSTGKSWISCVLTRLGAEASSATSRLHGHTGTVRRPIPWFQGHWRVPETHRHLAKPKVVELFSFLLCWRTLIPGERWWKKKNISAKTNLCDLSESIFSETGIIHPFPKPDLACFIITMGNVHVLSQLATFQRSLQKAHHPCRTGTGIHRNFWHCALRLHYPLVI